MVENFAKWPSERGQTAKVRSSEGCEGMEFPWRWISGTIFTNLDVIWGMSDERYYFIHFERRRGGMISKQAFVGATARAGSTPRR